MFRQYQHQDSGSVRTISGVSQSMEQMDSVNGSPTEESAPSTVIELTVDSPSGPTEPSGEAEPVSVTVSNILRGAGEGEQKLGEEANVTVTQASEKQGKEVDEGQPEMPAEESVDHPTLVCDREGADDGNAEDTTTEVLLTEDDAERGPSSAMEGSTNEDSELPSESASCLESSALGGASVFNEDLVDVSSVSDQAQPSDADDSQEESSSIPGPAGEEEEEEIQHEQEKGEEMKDEKQKIGTEETTKASETRVEQDVTETPKDADNLEQSSTVTPTTPADTTTAPTAQEAPAPSASTSDRQPSGAAATAEEPATSEHGSTAASSSGKTKEIRIARLDVSNVASDTERLKLKETVGIVPFGLISQTDFV